MNNGATLGLPLGIRYSINRIINKKKRNGRKKGGGGERKFARPREMMVGLHFLLTYYACLVFSSSLLNPTISPFYSNLYTVAHQNLNFHCSFD